MQIIVKVLLGDELPIQVSEYTSIAALKELIKKAFNIPIENQKLVFNGRSLADNKTLCDYQITDHSRVHVWHRSPGTTMEDQLPPLCKRNRTRHSRLRDLLYTKLLPYFSEENAFLIVGEFMKDFNAKMATLSMDDIERLAAQFIEEDKADANSE